MKKYIHNFIILFTVVLFFTVVLEISRAAVGAKKELLVSSSTDAGRRASDAPQEKKKVALTFDDGDIIGPNSFYSIVFYGNVD